MWMQDLFFILILSLLLGGFVLSRRLIHNDRWEALGLMVGMFYFVFVPLIAARELKVLDPNIPRFTETVLPLVILFIFVLETLLVFAFLSRDTKEQPSVSPGREMFMYWASIILYFSFQLYVLFASGLLQGGHWYFTRHEFIEEGGTLIILAMYLIWAARLIIVSYTFEFLHLKRLTLIQAGAIVSLIMAYEFLYVGNRIVILMIGIAGFLYIARRYGTALLLAVIGALLPVMVSLGVYQDVRRLLYELSPMEFLQTLVKTVANQNTLLGLSKVFESWDLVFMLDLFEKTGVVFTPIYGSSFLRVFAWVIPRSIWADKPLTVTVQVGELYIPGRGVSMVPLLWGEVYLNFWIFGLLLYPLILWLTLKLIRSLCQVFPMNNYLKFLLGFLIIRQPVADVIVNIIVLSLLYAAIRLFWKILPQKKFVLGKPRDAEI